MCVVAQPSTFPQICIVRNKKSLYLACRNLVDEAALRHGGKSDGDSGLDMYISAMRSRVENTTQKVDGGTETSVWNPPDWWTCWRVDLEDRTKQNRAHFCKDAVP